MSNENKTSMLPLIFHAIGLIATIIFSFMGLSYILNGDLTLSILIPALAVFVLVILVHYLTYWKTKKQRSNDDMPNHTPEIILGMIYGLLFLCLSVIGFHYLHINFSKKNEVRSSGLTRIKNLTNLGLQYTTAVQGKVNTLGTSAETAKQNYINAPAGNKTAQAANINTLLDPFKPDYTLSGVNFENDFQKNLDEKKSSLETQYQSPVDSMKKAADVYIKDAESVFKNWKFLKLGYYYTDAKKFYERYYNKMTETMSDFTFDPEKDTEIKFQDPLSSIKGSKIPATLLFFIILLVVHLCVLAPYFAAKRPEVFLSANTGEYKDDGDLIKYINQRK